MTAALSTAKPIVGAAINRALKRSAGRSRHAGYPITADAERTAATSRKSRIPILLSLWSGSSNSPVRFRSVWGTLVSQNADAVHPVIGQLSRQVGKRRAIDLSLGRLASNISIAQRLHFSPADIIHGRRLLLIVHAKAGKKPG